jgi:hypothetical protein
MRRGQRWRFGGTPKGQEPGTQTFVLEGVTADGAGRPEPRRLTERRDGV